MYKIIILNYHKIEINNTLFKIKNKGESIYIIKDFVFKKHLEILQDNNYRTILFDDHVRLENKDSETTKQAIITFDDGNASDYSIAFPILCQYGFNATFFVTIKKIGSPEGLTYRQLREMSNNGMSIQSHTMTHSFLPELSHKKTLWELQESKKILEQELGKSVDYLSLPGGRCNATVKRIAIEVGYKGVCTSEIGYNYTKTDLYSLKRWTITKNMKIATFKSIINGKQATFTYYKTRYFLLGGLKRVLGNKLYATIHREVSGKINALHF
jgi:peptidoglycan/xylan/chitin deacetylase (PgdA/CDA1 family)